jgi:hypothetical protein
MYEKGGSRLPKFVKREPPFTRTATLDIPKMADINTRATSLSPNMKWMKAKMIFSQICSV